MCIPMCERWSDTVLAGLIPRVPHNYAKLTQTALVLMSQIYLVPQLVLSLLSCMFACASALIMCAKTVSLPQWSSSCCRRFCVT